MKKAWIKRNRKIIFGIGIFIVIFGIVGILMYNKMRTLLNYYVERQTAQQAELLAQTTEKQFAAELRQLTWTADYIQDHETQRQDIVNTFVDNEEGILVGLLEMDGNAVCGETLDFLMFDGIRQSFRGEDAVSYSKEKGLLFTVPVYRGRNVRYVLYKLYDEGLLYDKFGLSCYGGSGRTMIMDMQEQIVISGGDTDEDAVFFDTAQIYEGYLSMREQLQVLTSTSVHVKAGKENYFLFSAEVDNTDMILIGYVPENVAMEGISYLVVLVLWVFGLLMVVLIIGMVYLFGAEEKARESDELREAKLMADKANRAKSDFLANMSHEIRTPINAVMGMNEMILRECEQEDIREYAQNIQGASQTLLSLINDILDFSKIESGKMEIVEEAYDTASMLNDVINMVRVKAESKNLRFHVNVDEKLPSELWGDGTRVRQVIINILNNAVKYTKEGQVTLCVTGERSGVDKVLLEIRVSDTGIGIKEEDMPKLFGNFERLNLEENRNVEGTGLGLAITYRLVEQMSGRIDVESKYGEGSTFTVYLQQGIVSDSLVGDFQERYQLAMKRNRRQYRESFIAPQAKILVVDDTAMNLLVIEQLLKKTRVQVTTCLSGNACLEMVRQERYDVILLDHMMPEMDGIETLKLLKEMEDNRCQDVPVIALTANAIVGVREMYMDKGFDDYLSKPVEGLDLEEMLRRYIPEEKQQEVTEREKPFVTIPQQIQIKDGKVTDIRDEDAQNVPAQQNLQWLDVDMGIRYCGDSEEVYREVLQEFCDVEQTEKDKIEKAYENEDWKNYAILMHGLKSSSLSAGAKKLSDEAAGLEKSSREIQKDGALHKEEILAYIREYHGKMMELYRESSNEGRRYLQS